MSLTTTQIAAAVRAELARAKLSGRAVARELDYTPAKLHRRLNGSHPFRIDELVKIADLLGVPVATFVAEPRPTVKAAS